MQPIVRTERPADFDGIRSVVTAAFGSDAEAALVDGIRASEHYMPELSLVAEIDSAIVGHVMISRVTLVDGETRHVAHTMAPVAVAPDHQRHGIGGAVIRKAIELADDMGLPMILVEGSPTYYGRFGFEHAVRRGIHFDLPDWAPAEAAQVLPLARFDPRLRGKVEYPPAFLLVD
jgi:putative acetyltransferase